MVGGADDGDSDLVVTTHPFGAQALGQARAVGRLESLGLRVIALEPQTFADTRRMVRVVAQALGRADEGEALWRRIEARIDE